MRTIPTVAVTTLRNEILLLKRSKVKSYPGMWCTPGGKMEPGETEWEAAKRELIEETGIPPHLIPAQELTVSDTFTLGEFRIPIFHLKIDQACPITLEKGKASAWGWFDLTDPTSMQDLLLTPGSAHCVEILSRKLS